VNTLQGYSSVAEESYTNSIKFIPNSELY